MLSELPLNELRQARRLSQKMLADVMHIQQPSIAKIEKRADMYISTLRSRIEAMGGELEVVARYPMAMSRSVTSRTSKALPLREYRY
jgi:predicted transcriptional regulator